MSTKSARSRGNRRINSLQGSERLSIARTTSRSRPKPPSHNDAYTFALRAAYLHHLLQPRIKRKQYVPAPKPIQQRKTVMIGELIQDFSHIIDTKSAKLPHGFMSPLEKRLQGVVMGTEKLPGFNDAGVRRTFAEAYTAFTEQGFRKRMDKERRVEDLVLIFYSNATKALQKTQKGPEDDSWKLLVDRHVALFVRLISNTLRDHGNDKDRPELMGRLATLEKKLLTNDQDLTVNPGTGAEGTTIEVTVPISRDVKDMAMVQTVGKIFGLPNSHMQSDVDANKKIWTEEAALMDLKAYQYCLDSNTKRTLRSDDFDLDEGYQAWKKGEIPELSQLMADILQAKPELVKSSSDAHNKPLPPVAAASPDGQAYSELAKTISNPADPNSMYSFDQPVDMSALSIGADNPEQMLLEQSTYTFIPPEPRAYYRTILSTAMTFERLHDAQSANTSVANGTLSRQSLELMAELCLRWRIPQFSRLVLFEDVAAQKFLDQEIGLDELDAAFEFVKNPPPETKRPQAQSHTVGLLQLDQRYWTVQDYALHRQILVSLHDGLLRDLYDLLQHCYDAKPPSPGPVLVILESHIYNDPSFSQDEVGIESYRNQLTDGLRAKAAEVYRGYLETEVPQDQEEWEFFHVVQLGKSVVKLCERIQKRYRKNPDIMGVNPLTILVETMFPSFENDANDLIQRILHVAQTKETEVDVQDGFDLYKELVEIRRIHHSALPNQAFAFHIESRLSDFVWRWIRKTDEKMIELIDQMIKQDEFKVRSDDPQHSLDDDRHSSSVLDMFQLFNQTSDQIYQLEWDDDVQYAKFMTALSKTFGTGLARYCEVLDQRFNKEMDRLSPAQMAAASQTKQEKWMQLAKDAWNNKEKIEPFQFYPESFVKLNNIEYAIRQLDNLEKTMNVDACAEVLAKVEPPKDKRQRPSKYVFTIKIVEAEDIKACDPNGTSDPYVVLGDEYQKRLAKTRIVMRNLNPRWDESVDITVSGPLVIIATIWDWDTFGDHDYVGRTNLKLDPAHFMDYMPREYWLDLDTQGRLLLRVSMEGERDDIQFYFGKAFRLAKRTERDMTRVITDKLSQYINASLSQDALRLLISGGGLSVASVTMLWKNRQSVAPTITPADIENALKPLLEYFDENFAIMKQTLTDASMVMVMTRLWKEVLLAVESLLVPPLSDKPSPQRPLTQQELDIVFRWLEILFEFFNARDEETGEVLGVPADVLKSPKYHELASLNFFYFDTTDNLIRTSERMASATAQRAQAQRNRLSAPATLGASFGGLMGGASVRRAKSIMMSRNLGTMRKAKEEKRKEAQADPSDDMILRILRMRPEATPYIRDRSRQKSRLEAAAAAESVVRQSLAQGGGPRFGANNLPRR